MKIGTKIADARKKQNLTQEQLAELMGVTRQSISRWESNAAYPEIEKIVHLVEILKINCDYLLRDDYNESGEKVITKEIYIRDNSYINALFLTYLSFIPLFGIIFGINSLKSIKTNNYDNLKRIAIGGIIFSAVLGFGLVIILILAPINNW